jgi:hypothetical protein
MRAYLILRVFALSRQVLARLRRANNLYGVWNRREAPVPHTILHQASAAGASKRS